jgi:addiction module HigA family antidote
MNTPKQPDDSRLTSQKSAKSIESGSNKVSEGKYHAPVDNIPRVDRQSISKYLLIAAEFGEFEFAKFLLDVAADVNVRGSFENTPLHLAARNGHTFLAKLLVRNRADVNALSDGNYTPLHFAARAGHEAIVSILINGGANVNLRNDIGDTALHIASGNGHLSIVQKLLDSGADINAEGCFGHTAIDMALSHSKFNTAKLLFTSGASTINLSRSVHFESGFPNSAPINAREILNLIIKYGIHLPVNENFFQYLRQNGVSEATCKNAARELTTDASNKLDEKNLDLTPTETNSHPGTILRLMLENNNKTVAESADMLGVTRQQLYRIFNGTSNLSPEMALKLENIFGTPAIGWLKIQAEFDIARLRDKHTGLRVEVLPPPLPR